MPTAYTSSQKSAIAQFVNFTSSDKSGAARYLKSAGWNVEAAVNAYFNQASPASQRSSSSTSITNHLNKLFDKYRQTPITADSRDKINIDGTMKYLEDLAVGVEDVGMLVVCEIVKSPGLGEINREGFVQGWTAHSADTIDKQKAVITSIRSSLSTPTAASTTLKPVYRHTFSLALTPPSKSLDLDMAIEYWKLLLSSPSLSWNTSNVPWLDYWIEFLRTHWKRAVNRDVWDQTLKFAEQCLADETLGWWDEEGAWPAVVDEFVAWCREQKGIGGTRNGEQDGDEMEY